MPILKADADAAIRSILAEKILRTTSPIHDATLANLDSLGRINLMVELENTFAISLTDREYGPEIFETIGALAAFVCGTAE